jgi:hypothetical protein
MARSRTHRLLDVRSLPTECVASTCRYVRNRFATQFRDQGKTADPSAARGTDAPAGKQAIDLRSAATGLGGPRVKDPRRALLINGVGGFPPSLSRFSPISGRHLSERHGYLRRGTSGATASNEPRPLRRGPCEPLPVGPRAGGRGSWKDGRGSRRPQSPCPAPTSTLTWWYSTSPTSSKHSPGYHPGARAWLRR